MRTFPVCRCRVDRVSRYLVGLLCLVFLAQSEAVAQDKNVVELTLHPCAVGSDPSLVRFLPAESQLRSGNAAIELLRMPWEQTNFMELERKMMNEWLEMEGDDPELQKYERAFLVFKEKMRRAAYTRDADWDYPLGEQPLMSILLPDVQGMRGFAGRVMSLWIRIQIAKGEIKSAEEGLLIQMACARHVSRTPFIVCQLVGSAIGLIGFEQFENLIQHPESRNYYHALAMLPNTFGDFSAAMDIEITFVRNSMPSLAGAELPPVGDRRWQVAFDEFFTGNVLSPVSSEVDQKNMLKQSKELATDLLSFGMSKDQVARMDAKEVCVRWLVSQTDRLGRKVLVAIRLPQHQAIQELIKIEKEASRLKAKTFPAGALSQENLTGAIPASMFDLYSDRAIFGCYRTGRRARLLQIVEAIRHHASQNKNRLPDSLSEIALPLPLDPFTNKPAEYVVKDNVATLRWPLVDNLNEKRNYRQSYRIKIAGSK